MHFLSRFIQSIGKSKWVKRMFQGFSSAFWFGHGPKYRVMGIWGRSAGEPCSKHHSATVDSSLKRRTWLLSAKYSMPPSKVQRGRVVIPGDFSVLEVNGRNYILFSLGIPLVAIQIRYQKLKHSIDRDLF